MNGNGIPDTSRGGLRWPAIITLALAAGAVGLTAGMLRADWRKSVLDEVGQTYQTQEVAGLQRALLDEKLTGITDDIVELKQDSREQREALRRLEELVRDLAAKIP